mgnify:FL=1
MKNLLTLTALSILLVSLASGVYGQAQPPTELKCFTVRLNGEFSSVKAETLFTYIKTIPILLNVFGR